MNEEALDSIMWRTRSRRGYIPVVRRTSERTKLKKNTVILKYDWITFYLKRILEEYLGARCQLDSQDNFSSFI